MCVVEDDKVSIEDLIEKITEENEDLVKNLFFCLFPHIFSFVRCYHSIAKRRIFYDLLVTREV